MAKKQKKDGGEPIDSVVRISKLKTNYKLTYDYNQRLSEFIKTLPREHWSVKVENTVINGKEKDIWSRVISEVEMGKVISFLMDNGLSFKFENVAEDDLNRLRREYLERQNKIAEILRLKAESLDVSDEDFSFLKRQPYDYQKQAVKFFELNNGSGILGDQPGVGKTLSAMAYAAKNKLKTLVICPASLKLNWRNEIKEFTNENSFVYKYKAKKKSKDILHTQDESIFHIINYESLDTYLKFEYKHKCKNKKCKWECDDLEKAYTVCPGCTLRGTITSKINGVIGFGDKAGIMLDPANYDLVVLDEAHYIKSPTANRTKLIKKAFLDVPKKILISGTAIKNRPMELFSLLNFLDGKDWNNSHAFGVRYAAGFDGPWGWDFGGASNLDELFTRISSFFLRRLKKDVLKFLPPKTFTNIPLELSEAEYREYKKVEKGIVEQINAETGETTETLTHHLANIHKLKMFTSKIKVNNAIEMIQDIIDADEKVVVFSQYVDIANKIKEHFGDTAVIFTGKNNITEKQAAVDGFQKNNKIKIFSGTIGAAGVGITLTAASKLIFVDSAWSPSDMEQASDRIHRASSTASNIQIIKFICEDTIDEDIEDLLLEKERVIGKALDNTVVQRKIGVADGSIFKDLISRIKQKS